MPSRKMLFFFNFKAGFYERFYSNFDPQAIIRSMKLFLQERNLVIDAYLRELREMLKGKDSSQLTCSNRNDKISIEKSLE